MSAIHEVVQKEIEKLRRDANAANAKADELEAELQEVPLKGSQQLQHHSAPETQSQAHPTSVERGGRDKAIINLLDSNRTKVFSPESMKAELGMRVDPSLVSRLKKEKRIAKARTGGYCSIHAPDSMKESSQPLIDYADAVEKPMTQ